MEKRRPHCPSSTCPLDPLLPIWILLLALFASIKSYGPWGTARPGGPTPGPPPPEAMSESRCSSRLRSWNLREQSFRSPCSRSFSTLACLSSPGPQVPGQPEGNPSGRPVSNGASGSATCPQAFPRSVQDQLCARGQGPGACQISGSGGSPEWEVLGRPG